MLLIFCALKTLLKRNLALHGLQLKKYWIILHFKIRMKKKGEHCICIHLRGETFSKEHNVVFCKTVRLFFKKHVAIELWKWSLHNMAVHLINTGHISINLLLEIVFDLQAACGEAMVLVKIQNIYFLGFQTSIMVRGSFFFCCSYWDTRGSLVST